MFHDQLKPIKPIESFSRNTYGIVDDPISVSHPGRVRFKGSFWRAIPAFQACRKMIANEFVEVLGRQGLTLLVIPIDEICLDELYPADEDDLLS